MGLVDRESTAKALTGVLRLVGSLLGEGKEDVLVSDLIVELRKDLRFIKETFLMHKDCLIVAAHLRFNDRDVQANLGHNERADSIDLELLTLRADLGLLLRLYLADHAQRHLEILQCLLRVLLLQVAIRQLIADIDVDHRVLVDDLVLDRTFRVLEFVDGVIDLTAIHDALRVAGLRLDVVVHAEFEDPCLTRVQV